MRVPSKKHKYGSITATLLALILLLPILTANGGSSVPSPAFGKDAGEGMPAGLGQSIRNMGDEDEALQEAAIVDLGTSGDANILPALEALQSGSLYRWVDPRDEHRIVIARDPVDRNGEQSYPLLSPYGAKPILDEKGQAVFEREGAIEAIRIGRRLRIAIAPWLDRLRLFSPSANLRESAATKVGLYGAPEALPQLDRALLTENDRWVRTALNEAIGLIQLVDDSPALRKKAAEKLGTIHALNALPTLEERIKSYETGEAPEQDIAVIEAIRGAIQKIEAWTVWTRTVETIFSGISLSSILLLVALGLAITFGLMGVINMAHGELMMLGAYTTYMTQEIFVGILPENLRDLYFPLAIPLAFVVAAAFGLVLEKSIIRRLYGRPLETLLATWGVSLILQQGVRHIFGAANVDVASPAWLRGGLRLATGIQFPYNRLFIILLSLVSVFGVYLLVLRSPIGLKIRAVTQNREMSACMGITTQRVDAWTFALGSGLAGMAGAALTLIGNIGPDLGQSYIVDSFLVVVTGGVGKLAGTVGAAFGIGGLNKLLEPGLGAIYAKVLILLIVILFLQGKPSGLFPAKGRNVDM